MKITIEHYAHIARALNDIKPTILEMIPAYKNAGFSDKRLRWDACYQAGLTTFICDTIYKYCDDSHIDTALRQYFSKLGV
jgi:hypothetical protein